MSIADHFTRSKMQRNESRVIGALFGVQNGREVQIYDAYEISFDRAASAPAGMRVHFDAFNQDFENCTFVRTLLLASIEVDAYRCCAIHTLR